MIDYLTLEDALALVSDLGVGPVRDIGLLDSAIRRATSVTVFGRDADPGLDAQAAVLLESIVRNHALVDGTKSLAWLAVVVFYGLNDVVLEAPDEDAYNLVIALASGNANYQDAAARLTGWHRRSAA